MPADDPTQIARVELLLRLVETEAESRLARGTPGAWGEVTRRCRSARELLGADPACEAVWHIYLVELEAWGEVLAQVMRPEREDELVGALRRRAELETPEDPEAWGRLLSLIHPGLRDREGSAGAETFLQMELGFYRAMRAFRARPTVASLRACLAMILELVRTVSHNPCGRDTLTCGARKLDFIMPLARNTRG